MEPGSQLRPAKCHPQARRLTPAGLQRDGIALCFVQGSAELGAGQDADDGLPRLWKLGLAFGEAVPEMRFEGTSRASSIGSACSAENRIRRNQRSQFGTYDLDVRNAWRLLWLRDELRRHKRGRLGFVVRSGGLDDRSTDRFRDQCAAALKLC